MLSPLAIIIDRCVLHTATVVVVIVVVAVAHVGNVGVEFVVLSVGVKTVILSVSVFGIVSIIPRLFVGGARVFEPIDDVVQLQRLVFHFPDANVQRYTYWC